MAWFKSFSFLFIFLVLSDRAIRLLASGGMRKRKIKRKEKDWAVGSTPAVFLTDSAQRAYSGGNVRPAGLLFFASGPDLASLAAWPPPR
jgi:hypothetical protein